MADPVSSVFNRAHGALKTLGTIVSAAALLTPLFLILNANVAAVGVAAKGVSAKLVGLGDMAKQWVGIAPGQNVSVLFNKASGGLIGWKDAISNAMEGNFFAPIPALGEG